MICLDMNNVSLKKIFFVIFFSLLLKACVTGDYVIETGQIYKGMGKVKVRNAMFDTYPGDDPFLADGGRQYYSDKKIEILWGYSRNKYYVFKNVTQPMNCGVFACKYGNGTLVSWHNTLTAAQNSLQPKKIAEKKEPKKTQPKKIEPKMTLDDSELIPAASGSGFFVTNTGYVVTNDHVIVGCRDVTIIQDGKYVKATVFAYDEKNDLAILKTNIKPKKFYRISRNDVKLLDDVVLAGYPLGTKISTGIKTSKGSITALAGVGNNYSNFQTDAALNKGNSGGPVLDRGGNVVGVAVAKWQEEGVESFNFGIKSSVLKSFAEANNIRLSTSSRPRITQAQLADLIQKGTVYIDCWLTVADIKRLVNQDSNKAFYSK